MATPLTDAVRRRWNVGKDGGTLGHGNGKAVDMGGTRLESSCLQDRLAGTNRQVLDRDGTEVESKADKADVKWSRVINTS